MDKLSDAALVTLRNRGIGCSGQRALDAVAAAEELCRRGNEARQLRKLYEHAFMYGHPSGRGMFVDIETQYRSSHQSSHNDMIDAMLQITPKQRELLAECRSGMTTVTGRTPPNYVPPMHEFPKKQGTNMTPTEQLKQAQDAVIAAEKAVAEQAERDAFNARVNRDLDLASATTQLLQNIKQSTNAASRGFAEFRNELNPLALTYGYKLVLIGDKSVASLVKV